MTKMILMSKRVAPGDTAIPAMTNFKDGLVWPLNFFFEIISWHHSNLFQLLQKHCVQKIMAIGQYLGVALGA